jgi:lipid II:glycine glycyltransferase (peptidoglycan interpeptide bridge formation enzyme)
MKLTPIPMATAALAPADDLALRREIAAFAADCPGNTYLQHPAWPDFARRRARQDYRLATVRGPDGALLLAGVLRRTALPGGHALGAFRRGPLVRRLEDLAPALSVLLPQLRGAGFLSVTLNPRWYDEEADACERTMRDLGARVVPSDRQTLHARTGLVDLDRSEEDLVASFSKTGRTHIRRLGRAGLSVRPLTDPAEIASMIAWFDDFARDRGMSIAGLPTVPSQLDYIRAHGGAAMAVDLHGAFFGAFTGLRDGDRLLPVANGWRDPNGRHPRSYMMDFALMRAGREMEGVRWLDLGGLVDERTIEGRPEAEVEAARRRDDFKMRFNPEVVRLPRIHEFVLRPTLHRLAMLAKRAL